MGKTMMQLRKRDETCCYISVDIESTGPTPGHYSMYEIGGVILGTRETFFRKFELLQSARVDKTALIATNMSEEKLKRRRGVVSPKSGMQDFREWIKALSGNQRPIFVANNAPFDWMFIAWYFEAYDIKNPFGHTALDMKAFYMGMTGSSWERSSLTQMAKHAGISFKTLPHQAVQDATIQGRVFANLLEKRKSSSNN